MGLAILTPRQQRAFEQLHLVGNSDTEAAALFGVEPVTIRVRIHRARCRLSAAAHRLTCADRQRYAMLIIRPKRGRVRFAQTRLEIR